jgi:hypothetical protein
MARSPRGVEVLSHQACGEALRDSRLIMGWDDIFTRCGIDDGPARETFVDRID